MTTFNNSTEKKGFYQQCFKDGTLGVLKPTTSAITEFRPIAEYVDGVALPMVKAMTPGGPDLSNLVMEDVCINAGNTSKFSGLCKASDATPDMNAVGHIMSGMYIRIKNKVKNNKVPMELQTKVNDLLLSRPNPKGDGSFSYLPRAAENGFIQGIGLSLNSKPFDKPRSRQALCLTKPAVGQLFALAEKWAKEGKDIFSAKEGYSIIIKGLPKDPSQGRHVPMYVVELGKQLPISEDTAKKLWTPWETAFKRYTTAENLQIAIKLFGRDIVEFAFPDEVAMHIRSTTVVSAAVASAISTPAPAASKPAETKVVSGKELALEDTGAPVIEGEPEDVEANAPAPAPAPAAAAAAASAAAGSSAKDTKNMTAEELTEQYKKLLGDL